MTPKGGNTYDKYGTRNPVARWLMHGFLDAVKGFLPPELNEQSRVLEVGCGEGHLLNEVRGFYRKPPQCFGCDVGEPVIAQAQRDYPETEFRVASIYQLPYQDMPLDLVVCCEVCEHLEDPHLALERLRALNAKCYILSVPREPLWRMLNLVRMSYWGEWGNTPGHIQHWTKNGFVKLVERVFTVEKVSSPLPWTVIRAHR